MVKLRSLLYVLLAVLTLTLALSSTALAQTDALGIVKYKPLPGWNKTTNEDVVGFSTLNQKTGEFCIITLHGATSGTGSPANDFNREWSRLAVQPLNAKANPSTNVESSEGWTETSGGSLIEFQGGKAMAFLTVFSGYGKAVSVLGVLNGEGCVAGLHAFLKGVEIDKPAAAPSTGAVNRPAPQTDNAGQSGSGKFGLMSYVSPAGWNVQQFADGVVLKPTDLPAGEVLVMQIMQPLNASGTLPQALQQSYDEAAAMYKGTKMHFAGGANYQATDARKSFNGWEYIRGKGGVKIENGSPYPPELGLELFVVKVNNRFERVAILESRPNCKLSRYYSSDRRSYRNGIEGFLFSLQFADTNERPLARGTTDGQGIVGVWQGISLATGAPSVSAPSGIRYHVFSPIFLSNGQAYFGSKFPIEGLEGLDTRIPPELNRRDWGSYSFSNGRGVLKMPYAEIPLRMQGDKLIITANQTDHAFYRLPSVDGATFNGTYALSEVNGKIPSITFSSDGRFSDDGAIKVMYHEYVDCINLAPDSGSGTYAVNDYSVMFTYADGRMIKLAFLGADYAKSNPSPATLRMSFNEDPLTRR